MKTKERGIGRYAITDSYHHYANLPDLQIFAGMSGSPLKSKTNDKEYIVGMNVSIPYQPQGANPFKLIYFLKIKYIFDFLREQGVLIYDIDDNSTVKIKWIYTSKNDEGNDYEKTILVFGGSGAGKSSFIKSFALNSKLMDGSGDGQTTRTNIYYEFYRYHVFEAKVSFLKKKEFIKQRTEEIQLDLIEFIFHSCVTLKEEMVNFSIYDDAHIYMKKIRGQILKDPKDSELLEFINDNLGENFDFDISRKESDDEERGVKIAKSYNKLFKKEGMQKYLQYKEPDKEDYEKLIEILLNKQGLFDVREFKFIFKPMFDGTGKLDLDQLDPDDDEKIVIALLSYYFYENGTTDIEDNIKQKLKNILIDIGSEEQKELRSFYECLYIILQRALRVFINTNDLDNDGAQREINKKNIVKDISFNEEIINNREKREMFIKCLKIHGGSSLTSLIDRVDIKDSLSNDYVYMLDSLELTKVKFIDTKGLDHIEKGVVKAEYIHKVILKEKENREEKWKDDNKYVLKTDGIDAIFYLKKTDSGKPTELETIIPEIYNIAPQIPIYIGFTGIDIFFKDLKDGYVEWKRGINDDEKPRAVRFIQTPEGKNMIKNKLNASENMKEILYDVMSRNVFSFYGKEEGSDNFIDNNKFHIKKLFKSIIVKEYNSFKYLPSIQIEEGFKEIIGKLMDEFLVEAKRIASDYKSNTKIAIFNRISRLGLNEFGFEGTRRSRIDLIFNDAYNNIFSNGKSLEQLLSNSKGNEEILKYQIRIETLIKEIKNEFLGTSKELYQIVKKDDCGIGQGEERFIEVLNKMYQGCEYNPYNIVETYILSMLLNDNATGVKKKINKDICKFKEQVLFLDGIGLKDSETIDRWIKELISLLSKTSRRKYNTWIKDFTEGDRQDKENYKLFFELTYKIGDDISANWEDNVFINDLQDVCISFSNMKNIAELVSLELVPGKERNNLYKKIKNEDLVKEVISKLEKIIDKRYEDVSKDNPNEFVNVYTDTIFNFNKISKNDTENQNYKEHFVKIFIEKLKNAMRESGTNMIDNLLRVDEDFKSATETFLPIYIKLLGREDNIQLKDFIREVLDK